MAKKKPTVLEILLDSSMRVNPIIEYLQLEIRVERRRAKRDEGTEGRRTTAPVIVSSRGRNLDSPKSDITGRAELSSCKQQRMNPARVHKAKRRGAHQYIIRGEVAMNDRQRFQAVQVFHASRHSKQDINTCSWRQCRWPFLSTQSSLCQRHIRRSSSEVF